MLRTTQYTYEARRTLYCTVGVSTGPVNAKKATPCGASPEWGDSNPTVAGRAGPEPARSAGSGFLDPTIPGTRHAVRSQSIEPD